MGHLSYKKTCEWCGKAYYAQKITTNYCSHTCASRAYKARKRAETMAKFETENARVQNKDPAVTTKGQTVSELDVMTPRIAASYLGIGKTTLYRYIEGGKIKVLKLSGKTLIRRSDLDSMFVVGATPLAAPKAMPSNDEVAVSENDYYTTRQISEILGMSMAGTWALLKREKVKSISERGMTYYEKKHIDRIKALRETEEHSEITEWYSTSEIIQKFNMTQAAVYSMAFDFGIPKKKVKNQVFYSKAHVDAVKNKSKSNEAIVGSGDYYSVKQIMEKYHMTRDRVDHYLRYYKVPRIRVGKIIMVPCKEFDDLFAISLKNCLNTKR